MSNKLIINFTPTGMIPTKKQNPHVPISIEEIIQEVKLACDLGITMAHLHIRNEATQDPCYKKETYARIIAGIREFAPDLIICASTSGRSFVGFEERSDVLQLHGDVKPDMASLTLSSLNFNKQASINEPSMIVNLAQEMLQRGIKPELEVFDVGMINYANYLFARDLLLTPGYFTLILGNIACAQADLLHIGLMIKDLPDHAIYSLGGVGDYQLPVNSLAVSMGYGVRVGLEDNIWLDPDRTRLASNQELLQRIHVLRQANGRELMSAAELRIKLGLKRGFGEYGF